MPTKKTSRPVTKASKPAIGASRPVAKGPAAMARLWVDALLRPAQTFASEKRNASWGAALLNYAIGGALGGLAAGLLYSSILASIFPATGALAFVFVTGIGAIAGIIGSLLMTLVFFIFAKLLGGKGTFRELYYCMSLYAVPLSVFYQIPFVNWLAGLYGIYLHVIAMREVNGFTTLRAAAAVFLPIVILAIVAMALALLFVITAVQTIAGGPLA